LYAPQQVSSSAPEQLKPQKHTLLKEQQPHANAPVYNANSLNTQNNPEQYGIQQAYLNQQLRLAQVQQQSQQSQPSVSKGEYYYKEEKDGYIESMWSKKKDILKLVIMSMMILLALSFHSLVTFWMTDYLKATDFSFRQEIGFRLLYPLIVLLLLWNLKTFK
jgi:hypothetical protein